MRRRFGAIVLAAGALAGCGGNSSNRSTTATATTGLAALPRLSFSYPRGPLGFKDRGVVLHRGSVTVHDVSFTSGGRQVDAYLVEAAGTVAHPAVVLVHGSGGDRSELLGDAVALAQLGVTAMTITAPSTAYPPPQATSDTQLVADSRLVTVADVVAVRRAADVLTSLHSVDPKRIGYLGWSAGAKTGAFVAAVDPRFKALALLSAGADRLSAFVKSAPAALRPLVRRELGSVDPLRYIAAARPGTLLLEDGRKDEVVPQAALRNVIAAAPSGTLVRWYAANHELNAVAYRAAFSWLAKKLGAKR